MLEPSGRGLSCSIPWNLDRALIGDYRTRCPVSYTHQIRSALVHRNLQALEYMDDFGAKYNRRITAICWHPTFTNWYASGSKFGDITIGHVERSLTNSSSECWTTRNWGEREGGGAGCSMTAMLFDPEERHILYATSIDSTVSKIDLIASSNSIVYHNYASYSEWFTSMDVGFQSKTLLAGSNKGEVLFFDVRDAKPKGQLQLHRSKIHHIEFNKHDSTMLVTAGLPEGVKRESYVKLWDLRKMKKDSPVEKLPHNVGVNIARFHPMIPGKLLTSDQLDEIRVYQWPFCGKPLIIKHHHKQFQHITPVTANWHPLTDVIVIGNYPKSGKDDGGEKRTKELRCVEFLDSKSGKLVAHLIPPVQEIVSLNVFNPTGELLASGMNSKLIIWRPSTRIQELNVCGVKAVEQTSTSLSQNLRERIRGMNRGTRNNSNPRRRRREYSPDSDEENTNKKKRRSQNQKKVSCPKREKR